MTVRILSGDCRTTLPMLADASAQCCVTSPPYWGLRDYGCGGQLGLEATPDEFIANMVGVFREVRRVLRDDGTLWLNIGDSYASRAGGYDASGSRGSTAVISARTQSAVVKGRSRMPPSGLKPKDLVGIPWMLAFALRADGWYLRSDIIWSKPTPVPESVTDRPTKSHEYLFLLTKSPRYFYDADAVRTPLADKTRTTFGAGRKSKGTDGSGKIASHGMAKSMPTRGPRLNADGTEAGANLRTVWTIASKAFDGAHFATFPPALVEPCVLAGTKPGDTVLDPFGGTFTTAAVATTHGRGAIVCELNPAYVEMGRERLGLFAPAREVGT